MGTSSLSQIIRRTQAAGGQVITPQMDKWLNNHPEGVVTRTDADKKLLLRLTSDESNGQRTARIGASSRGTCKRQQVFRFLGMPGLRRMDSVLQNIFNDGTWRHIRHQMMGMQGGWLTDVEVKFKAPQWNLGTSADGVNEREGYLFELKGMRYYGKVVEGNIPPGHMLQMHTMMLASGYDRTIYLVEDKGSQDWKEIMIQRDPKIIQTVKDELNAISDSIEDKRLPAVESACRLKKGDEYQGCPYKIECPHQRDFPEGSAWGPVLPPGGQHGQSGGLA